MYRPSYNYQPYQPPKWYPSGIYFTPPLDPASPYFAPTPVYLPLLSVSLKSTILSTTTRTTLTQTFHNPSITPINETHYNFPLYANSCILSFLCHIGTTKTITGIVKPTWDAKITYETAVRQGLTAGLLEQKTTEIFTTHLGNIPPNTKVKVVLEYVAELKHDAQADGILFTVPTAVAPRYGAPPPGVFGPGTTTTPPEKGTSLSISISMTEPIRSVQSTSHPVFVQLGTHCPPALNSKDVFDPTKAIVTLHQSSTVLAHAFTLVITTITPSHLSTPTALLETHPTRHSRALMLTLVPRFTAPPADKPDIIFIVDRSGSMADKVTPLRSALRVFLKSLPVGCRFNIVGFGTDHYSLWPTPRPYTRETLQEAEYHVSTIAADMGGTELLPAVKAVVEQEVQRELEVMVLTDGEVWGLEMLLECVRGARKKTGGLLRVFSLGMGRGVSHALVEGLARAGGGTSVVLPSGEEEAGLAGKVVGMLRCALGAHVDGYKLEVEYEPEDDSEGTVCDKPEERPPPAEQPPASPPAKKPKIISLFSPDTDQNRRSPTPTDEKFRNRFAHLTPLSPPIPLQTPYEIPPLFAFDRTTVYLSLQTSRIPTSITFNAATPAGDTLTLSIPVARAHEGATIHALAARAQLRDLEEGRSWVHAAVTERVEEYVEREGERVGVEWGIAGKWTSFVAVEDGQEKGRKGERQGQERRATNVLPKVMKSSSVIRSPMVATESRPRMKRSRMEELPMMREEQKLRIGKRFKRGAEPQIEGQQQFQYQQMYHAPVPSSAVQAAVQLQQASITQPAPSNPQQSGPAPRIFFHHWAPPQEQVGPVAAPMLSLQSMNSQPRASRQAAAGSHLYSGVGLDGLQNNFHLNNPTTEPPSRVHNHYMEQPQSFPQPTALQDYQMQLIQLEQQNKMRLQPLEVKPLTLAEKMEALIGRQEFDGSFMFCAKLVEVLAVPGVGGFMSLSKKHVTGVVAVFFEVVLAEFREVWMLVVEKAWEFVGEERVGIEKGARGLVEGREE